LPDSRDFGDDATGFFNDLRSAPETGLPGEVADWPFEQLLITPTEVTHATNMIPKNIFRMMRKSNRNIAAGWRSDTI